MDTVEIFLKTKQGLSESHFLWLLTWQASAHIRVIQIHGIPYRLTRTYISQTTGPGRMARCGTGAGSLNLDRYHHWEEKKQSVPAHCFVSEPAVGRHWCFRRLQPTSVAFLLRKAAYTCGGNKPKMKTDTLAASPSLSELWTAKSAPKARGTGGRRWLLGQCRHWWQRGLSILIRAPAKVKIDGSL